MITKNMFSEYVKNKVLTQRLTYIEATVEFCEEYSIDPSDVKKIITPLIFQKIEGEAIESRAIKSGNVLPI